MAADSQANRLASVGPLASAFRGDLAGCALPHTQARASRGDLMICGCRLTSGVLRDPPAAPRSHPCRGRACPPGWAHCWAPVAGGAAAPGGGQPAHAEPALCGLCIGQWAALLPPAEQGGLCSPAEPTCPLVAASLRMPTSPSADCMAARWLLPAADKGGHCLCLFTV